MRRPTVVLFSGGLDSTVLLAWALGRGPVATLTVEGPDRPWGERRAASAILDHYGVKLRHEIGLPSGIEGWVEGDRKRSYVPGRNLFHHSAALLLANRLGARSIAAGHLKDDAATFADARRTFFDALEALNEQGTGRRALILTPFLGMDKADVVALGRRLDAPLGLSWSCYRDGSRPCGTCDACHEREAALTPSEAARPRPPRVRAPPRGRRARAR